MRAAWCCTLPLVGVLCLDSWELTFGWCFPAVGLWPWFKRCRVYLQDVGHLALLGLDRKDLRELFVLPVRRSKHRLSCCGLFIPPQRARELLLSQTRKRKRVRTRARRMRHSEGCRRLSPVLF
jgi:hypothetical protein